MKRIYWIIVCVLTAALVLGGCAKETEGASAVSAISPNVVSQEEPNRGNRDPLTGLYGVSDSAVGKRPVAVMINNISTAQPVQTGLNDAGIVFESMVEGGITRLMAVYSDISSVEQIGTIRSARYTYVQLAKSLDAVYVHCGMDDLYTRPYANSLDFDYFDLGANDSYAFREENGLAYEHTLYAKGKTLQKGIDKKFRTDIDKEYQGLVFQFTDPEETRSAGAACSKVSFSMSGEYQTTFEYDADSKMFVRQPRGDTHRDYITGEKTASKNLLLLVAPVYPFDDDYHVRTVLDGGSGYYISEGGYTEINWSKGGASDRLELTDKQGNALELNAGNSWIAFVPQYQSDSVVFE